MNFISQLRTSSVAAPQVRRNGTVNHQSRLRVLLSTISVLAILFSQTGTMCVYAADATAASSSQDRQLIALGAEPSQVRLSSGAVEAAQILGILPKVERLI